MPERVHRARDQARAAAEGQRQQALAHLAIVQAHVEGVLRVSVMPAANQRLRDALVELGQVRKAISAWKQVIE